MPFALPPVFGKCREGRLQPMATLWARMYVIRALTCTACIIMIIIIIFPVSDSPVSSRPNNVLGVSPSATFFLLLHFYGPQSLPPNPPLPPVTL